MAQGADVTLHMYDLTHGMARTLSLQLLGTQIDAVYHTGVVVHGREVYFGAGVQTAAPGRTHFGPPHRTLPLGRTHVTREALEEFIHGVRNGRFRADTYDILQHNCNNFSDELCQFLLGRSAVPRDVLELPRIVMASPMGAVLAPMLAPMSSALAVSEAEPTPAVPTSHEAAVPVAPATGEAADDSEAAFEAAVRAEFERLIAAGTAADEAAEQAVSHVLTRSGLA